MRTANALIRQGGPPGGSESSLGAHAILLDLSWGDSIIMFEAPVMEQIIHSASIKSTRGSMFVLPYLFFCPISYIL